LPIDQAAVDAGLADLSAKLDVYEVILGKQKFLAGDVSMAYEFPSEFSPI
jgi:glutathione S-transferase